MTTLGIIVTEMVLCLGIALFIGALFGYLYGRAKSKERYEHKIDALQELCESKKEAAATLKTRYGQLEIENSKLQEECERCKELLVKCRTNEEELLAQLDIIAQENENLQQKLKKFDAERQTLNNNVTEDMLAKLTEIQKLLNTQTAQISNNKEAISRELEKAKNMIQNGDQEGKLNTLIHTVLEKIKPKK